MDLRLEYGVQSTTLDMERWCGRGGLVDDFLVLEDGFAGGGGGGGEGEAGGGGDEGAAAAAAGVGGGGGREGGGD